MEPIRVIGRVDLAQQIHAALLAEGADARLATAAAKAAARETGRDGTAIDVLASAFDALNAIKKAAPGRPVVMVTFDDPDSGGAQARIMASAARFSTGPDAHLPWPATGRDLLAACERAVEAARVPRPRVPRWKGVLGWFALLCSLGAMFWAFGVESARPYAAFRPTTLIVAAVARALLFASLALFWWKRFRAGTNSRRLWRAVFVAFSVYSAGKNVADALRVMLG
jgi:hypothetical protein